MSIIGKKYAPFDNSYVIDCETKKKKLIVQEITFGYSPSQDEIGATYEYVIDCETKKRKLIVQEITFGYSPSQDEIGATYEIVSEPYEEWVHFFFGKPFKHTFIKVKSSKSGNTYRTLYNERRIV